MSDSLAANELAEPLFNRFAHVYIETTVTDWLKWAATPKQEYERLDYRESKRDAKIHPAIYAFIAYRGEAVLRSKYTGERPNADPRKWEMASKVLYETEKPEMLRALVGEEITRDFCAFCQKKVISLEDVIEGNYTETDLQMDPAEKYATVVGISGVSYEHLDAARNFALQMGEEFGALFDNLWAKGDEKRMEKILERRLMATMNPESFLVTPGVNTSLDVAGTTKGGKR